MTEPREVRFQPYFGGFVLETLTLGMYGESRNALREYVQNGFDSIQSAIEQKLLRPDEGLITISYDEDGQGLRIRDNGAGLPVGHATSTLTSIGASRKDFRSDAGFRGIGRLAGITFTDTLVFATKAQGEAEQTVVTFDAKEMRRLMSPEHGSDQTAQDLLTRCVTAKALPIDPAISPFFEVALQGFSDAPNECIDPDAMRSFLSQVAPVRYDESFPFAKQIEAGAKAAGLPIETVRIEIQPVAGPLIDVRKPYGALYEVQDAAERVPLVDFKPYKFPHWWGWMGKKEATGAFLDDQVLGVRVRAKNIQIDGSDVVAEIFRRFASARTNERHQRWVVGEIFVDLSAVVPNARRDGFEETKMWDAIRREIASSVCKDAASWAQATSNKGQLSLEKLTDKSVRIEAELSHLRRSDFKNTDRTVEVSAAMTKLQGEVAKAARNADPPTLAALQHLGSQLSDLKSEALTKLSRAQPSSDAVEQQVEDRLLGELLSLFERRLELPCLSAVRAIIRDEYDWPRS